MSESGRKKSIRVKSTPSISDGYIDEYADGAFVVAVPAPHNQERRLSILFSRRSIEPVLGDEPEHGPPFRLVARHLAAITLSANAARQMAVDILRGLGDHIEEIEHPGEADEN